MKPLRRFFQRLISPATAQRDEERLQAEIEEHLALQTEENRRLGLSPADARREAVLKFGAVEAAKESYRDQRGLPLVETLIRDVQLALRRLRLAPAFTIATTVTLALGIALWVGAWPMFIAPVAIFATANWVHIPFEEAKMRRQFGATYEDYVELVRRWV